MIWSYWWQIYMILQCTSSYCINMWNQQFNLKNSLGPYNPWTWNNHDNFGGFRIVLSCSLYLLMQYDDLKSCRFAISMIISFRIHPKNNVWVYFGDAGVLTRLLIKMANYSKCSTMTAWHRSDLRSAGSNHSESVKNSLSICRGRVSAFAARLTSLWWTTVCSIQEKRDQPGLFAYRCSKLWTIQLSWKIPTTTHLHEMQLTWAFLTAADVVEFDRFWRRMTTTWVSSSGTIGLCI